MSAKPRVDVCEVILASASPRRRELLRQLGIEAQVQPADIDETANQGEKAVDYVVRLAAEKAATVGAEHPAALIVAADTCIELDGTILGKPRDAEHARQMLSSMSGRLHFVHTGVATRLGADTEVLCVTTKVEFAHLTSQDINNYWSSGEPQGKAGAYAIQGLGAALVKRIEGSYSNVVGLPLGELAAMLKRRGMCVLAEYSGRASQRLNTGNI